MEWHDDNCMLVDTQGKALRSQATQTITINLSWWLVLQALKGWAGAWVTRVDRGWSCGQTALRRLNVQQQAHVGTLLQLREYDSEEWQSQAARLDTQGSPRA